MSGIRELVEGIRARASANPGKMAGVTATYQFNLTGDNGGTFYVALNNGAADVQEGTAPNPQVTVSMAATDFHALVTGKLNPMTAFMGGRLKVSGDMGLAMKLQQLMG